MIGAVMHIAPVCGPSAHNPCMLALVTASTALCLVQDVVLCMLPLAYSNVPHQAKPTAATPHTCVCTWGRSERSHYIPMLHRSCTLCNTRGDPGHGLKLPHCAATRQSAAKLQKVFEN
eukprot:2281666-Amphidinium_carterae.1